MICHQNINMWIHQAAKLCVRFEAKAICLQSCKGSTVKKRCFTTGLYGDWGFKSAAKKGKGMRMKFAAKFDNIVQIKERKRVWHNAVLGPHMESGHSHGVSGGYVKRAAQLSVVFADHINNMVNSGEAHPLLPELGFTIAEVKMTSDLSFLNIYWHGTGTDKDEEIQLVLPQAASHIRYGLTNMHFMGHVPPVKFVKDMTQARVQEVEKLLSIADFGDGFEPSPLGHDMKQHDAPPTDAIQSDLDKLAKSFSKQQDMKDVKLVSDQNSSYDISKSDSLTDLNLQQRADLYNVDHAQLMNKVIQASKHKSRVMDLSLKSTLSNDINNFHKTKLSKSVVKSKESKVTQKLSADKLLAKERKQIMYEEKISGAYDYDHNHDIPDTLEENIPNK